MAVKKNETSNLM